MKAKESRAGETRIVLQVGSELRIKNNGDIVIDNPELELAGDDRAADAVLMYRLDPQSGEHILRLVTPVADHQHLKSHRRDD
jgi:phage gp45-like